jgi:hypothetical protein
MLSLDTLRLLSEILGTASVNVGSADFEETAPKLIAAKRELAAELQEAEETADGS